MIDESENVSAVLFQAQRISLHDDAFKIAVD
jgi:hypothetical protein